MAPYNDNENIENVEEIEESKSKHEMDGVENVENVDNADNVENDQPENNTQPQDNDDDNKLVTLEDLVEPMTNLWEDPVRLEKLRKEIKVLTKIRILPGQFPETVIVAAMTEVLSEVGWSDYNSFRNVVNRILTKPRHSVPFAKKVRDKLTGRMDYWLIRAFIDVKGNYEAADGSKFSKKEVLMSRQLCEYLREFCHTELKNEVQFWTFTGSGEDKQKLDISRLNPYELETLTTLIGETDADNLVMFQFKKKTKEVYVGVGIGVGSV